MKSEEPKAVSAVGPTTREILPGVLVCADADSVARVAARYFVEWAWQAIGQDGRFNVALSGGHTPQMLFQVLASQEFRSQVDCGRLALFWGGALARPHRTRRAGL